MNLTRFDCGFSSSGGGATATVADDDDDVGSTAFRLGGMAAIYTCGGRLAVCAVVVRWGCRRVECRPTRLFFRAGS